jgi:Flp pilus assembly pilin Flp
VKSSIRHFVVRLIADDSGQDLVEYALLAAFVALATMAGLKAIENAIGAEYVGWDTDEQNLWIPPDP